MKFGKKKQETSAEEAKPGKRNKKQGPDGPGSQKVWAPSPCQAFVFVGRRGRGCPAAVSGSPAFCQVCA